MSDLNAEAQARYYERQKERGYRKVCVYVPRDEAHRIVEYAKEIREAAKDG